MSARAQRLDPISLQLVKAVASGFSADDIISGLRGLLNATTTPKVPTSGKDKNGDKNPLKGSWTYGDEVPDMAMRRDGLKILFDYIKTAVLYEEGSPIERKELVLHQTASPAERAQRLASSPAGVAALTQQLLPTLASSEDGQKALGSLLQSLVGTLESSESGRKVMAEAIESAT